MSLSDTKTVFLQQSHTFPIARSGLGMVTNGRFSKIAVACGVVPCDTEEGRAFLQKRVALFAKVCLFLCAAHFLFTNLLNTVARNVPWSVSVSSLPNQIHLAGCVVFVGAFLLSRTGNRSHFQLALIDTLGMFLIGVLVGTRLLEETHGDAAHVALLDITIMVLARAVIVPSSGRRTFLISLLGTAPLIFGCYWMLGDSFATIIHGAKSVVVVVIAAVASRIIYGLRCEIREAKQFGQYTLEERIGAGGMGEVYKASHAMLRRPTAVKLLHPEKAADRDIVRFEREVQLTSQLTHPNTIAIYDYGHTREGIFYYAMEYLDGMTLRQLVDNHGPLTPGRVIHILIQICSSLWEAHSKGLIHRDIKPANIILCERGGVKDVVKVLDFGLVKNLDARGEEAVDSVERITGTPMYLSPEGIRSPGNVDARSDLYAVGAVGYYLLTGKRLFESENLIEIWDHQVNTPPVRPSSRLGKPVPGDLEGLILRCLEKDPDQRLQDAQVLHIALEQCKDAGNWTAEDAALWWRKQTTVAVEKSDEEVTADTLGLSNGGDPYSGRSRLWLAQHGLDLLRGDRRGGQASWSWSGSVKHTSLAARCNTEPMRPVPVSVQDGERSGFAGYASTVLDNDGQWA